MTWTLSTLGLLPGGHNAEATAINDSGVVVGLADDAGGVFYAVRWDSGVATVLDLPVDSTPITFFASFATGIDNAGKISGHYYHPFGLGTVTLPVSWTGTTPTVLSLTGGYDYGFAFGINNSGVIVGEAELGDDPCYWDSGGVFRLLDQATDVDQAGVSAVNDTGVVMVGSGRKTTPFSWGPALRWDDVSPSNLAGTPSILDQLSANKGGAGLAVNASGLVAGYTDDASGFTHAVTWTGTTILNTLDWLTDGDDAEAQGINDAGEVVGTATDIDSNGCAVYWGTTTSATRLPDLSGGDASASDINNSRVIVGSVFDGTYNVPAMWTFGAASDVLSTVATIDHDLLIGVEEDQHHAKVHDLAGQDHSGGFFVKTGWHPQIADADFTVTPINGQVAMTYDTQTGQKLWWVRAGGTWDPVEVTS